MSNIDNASVRSDINPRGTNTGECEEMLNKFQQNCQRAEQLARELQVVWTEVRDYCLQQEKLVDPENDGLREPDPGKINTDILNDEVYSRMYSPWREYRRVQKMLDDSGVAEMLDDTLSFDRE